MMLVRICQSGALPPLINYVKNPVFSKSFTPRIQSSRLYATGGRSAYTRVTRRSATLKERLLAPAGDSAFSIGKGAVAAGSAFGLAALCYYGLDLSSSTSSKDRALFWPQQVKDRIKDTYKYFGLYIAATTASVALYLRSPTALRLLWSPSPAIMIGSMVLMMGTGALVHSLPYQEKLGAKHVAWLAHAAIVGAALTNLCALGGPVILRAAWYTAGAVGGLSALAICAPEKKFLYYSGPLAVGLGAVFMSCIASMFLPPTTAIGSGFHAMNVYGGLIVFSLLLLYNTQRIIDKAEKLYIPYDPINNSMSISMDTLNIFIRFLDISSRKK